MKFDSRMWLDHIIVIHYSYYRTFFPPFSRIQIGPYPIRPRRWSTEVGTLVDLEINKSIIRVCSGHHSIQTIRHYKVKMKNYNKEKKRKTNTHTRVMYKAAQALRHITHHNPHRPPLHPATSLILSTLSVSAVCPCPPRYSDTVLRVRGHCRTLSRSQTLRRYEIYHMDGPSEIARTGLSYPCRSCEICEKLWEIIQTLHVAHTATIHRNRRMVR